MKQISLIVCRHWCEGRWVDNTYQLNEFLEKGWKVISSNPMGSSAEAGEFASLVILERPIYGTV